MYCFIASQPTCLHLKRLFCSPSCNNKNSSVYLVILVVSKNFTPTIIPFYSYPELYISSTLSINHSHEYINMTLQNPSLPTHFPPATILCRCSSSQ